MRINALWIATAATLLASLAQADDVRYYDQDGITYREIRRVYQQSMPETRMEAREQTVMREKVTYDLKEVDQSYHVPITEYQWVPYWQPSWNPFTPPTLAYRQQAVTRWETRTEKVRIPVSKREVVPEKITMQVPVTSQRMAQREYVTREPVSIKGTNTTTPGTTSTNVASRPTLDPYSGTTSSIQNGSGARVEGDPPRQASPWRAGDLRR